jgi:uncharacterized HAD superfamily protein
MKIGIDIDEVLAYFLPALIKYHNTTYGTTLKCEHFLSYRFWETWGGTKEDSIQKVYDFFKTNIFKNLEPVNYSQEAVNILKKNNDLIIITARQEEVIEITQKWIDEYFPNMFSDIFFTNSFSKTGVSISKKQICDSQGVEVLIEDSDENAKECYHQNRKIFLIDYPWNRNIILPKEVSRVNSWNEIIQSI